MKLFLIFFFFRSSIESFLQITYGSYFSGYTLELVFNEKQNQKFIKFIDTVEQSGLFCGTPHKEEQVMATFNKAVKTELIPVEALEVKASLLNITFSYSCLNIKDYIHFPYANDIVSFAYKFNHPNESLILQLYEQKLIENRTFAFVPQGPGITKGKLYLGHLPESETKDLYKAKCELIPQNPFWSCHLKYIFFDNYASYFGENQIVIFQTGIEEIVVPVTFFKALQEHFLVRYFSEKSCKEVDLVGKIECQMKVVKALPGINIVIDKTIFHIQMRKLFKVGARGNKDEEEFVELNMIENKHNEDEWIFGTNFLSNFVVKFDHDDKYLNFYSEEKFHKIREGEDLLKKRAFFIIKVIAVCIIVILVCNIFIISTVKFSE